MSGKPYCFKIGQECPHEIDEDPKLVFVLMPFAPEFNEVYEKGIKPAWESKDVKLRCVRADELFHTRDIMCQICQNIQKARFVVADMTGRNPNVFYELGLAHAFAKEAILITQSTDDVPVDLRLMRFIRYKQDATGLGKLAVDLRKTARGLLAQAKRPRPATPTALTTLPDVVISPKDGQEMVLIRAGEFIMGSDSGRDNEKPQRKVYLPGFYIGRYPVTNAQFEAFVKATSYQTEAEKAGSGWVRQGDEWEKVEGTDWRHPSGPVSSIAGKERHPLVQVSWNDAVAYAQWAGKRLPSEAEWEKAARGTDGRTWPWGDEWVDGKCNTSEINVGDTAPVGRYSPAGDSPYGVADMAGNVWEWTADWYQRYPGSKHVSDDYERKYRVLRGGSWFFDQYYARCACRGWYDPDDRLNYVGFRVAE